MKKNINHNTDDVEVYQKFKFKTEYIITENLTEFLQ